MNAYEILTRRALNRAWGNGLLARGAYREVDPYSAAGEPPARPALIYLAGRLGAPPGLTAASEGE